MTEAIPLVFSAPQYMQTKDKKPAYYFTVNVKEPLVVSFENKPTISDALTTSTGQEFVKTFAEIFASSCSKFFPKPLIAEKLIPKLNHIIKTIDEEHQGAGVIMWNFLPISICVSGISLEVYWKVIKTSSVIDWEEPEPTVEATADAPESEESEPPTRQTIDENTQNFKEVGSDDIIHTGEDKTEFILGPSAATKEKDKKKLREAKLQVELARFRAARAYEKYIAKYGDDLSDTETEAEESDYE
jgi:hypothetical protein